MTAKLNTLSATKTQSKGLPWIDMMINSIRKRGKALRRDSHACLVAIIDHANAHGDYDRLPKLFEAVKESLGSSMSQAMINWVSISVENLNWNDDEKKFEKVKGEKNKIAIRDLKNVKMRSKTDGGKEMRFNGNARDLPYYELEKEVKQEPFNLDDAFEALIKRAEGMYQKNVKEGAHNLVNAAQIELLKSVKDNLKTIKPANDTLIEKAETEEPALTAAA